jgi:hypothetical protein
VVTSAVSGDGSGVTIKKIQRSALTSTVSGQVSRVMTTKKKRNKRKGREIIGFHLAKNFDLSFFTTTVDLDNLEGSVHGW